MSNGYFQIKWQVSQAGTADVNMEFLMKEFPEGNATDEELIQYLHLDIDSNDQLKMDIYPPRPEFGQEKYFIQAARQYMKDNIEGGGK